MQRFTTTKLSTKIQIFCSHPPNPKWKGGGERGNLAHHIHLSPMTIGTKNQSPTKDIRWIDHAAHQKDGIDIPPLTQINERGKRNIITWATCCFPSAFFKIWNIIKYKVYKTERRTFEYIWRYTKERLVKNFLSWSSALRWIQCLTTWIGFQGLLESKAVCNPSSFQHRKFSVLNNYDALGFFNSRSMLLGLRETPHHVPIIEAGPVVQW